MTEWRIEAGPHRFEIRVDDKGIVKKATAPATHYVGKPLELLIHRLAKKFATVTATPKEMQRKLF